VTAFDATVRRSPLEGTAMPDGLRELPFLAQLDLRLDPSNTAVASAVAAALGFGLPVEPNTVAGAAGPGDLVALWLGPDEWLVLGPPGRETELDLALRAALGGAHGSVVDVSANRTTLELAGAAAREVLEGGCPIDLHPRVFGPGRCAQTLLARANVVLWHLTDEPVPVYRLLVRPSFAAYVVAWLTDALGDV
jgi:sarcosine oxidase, subunit gamma